MSNKTYWNGWTVAGLNVGHRVATTYVQVHWEHRVPEGVLVLLVDGRWAWRRLSADSPSVPAQRSKERERLDYTAIVRLNVM